MASKLTKKTLWGFDTKDLTQKVRPQDDFYHHVNKAWMDKNPIPANESRWGTFTILRYDTEKKLHGIVKELDAKRNVASGTPERAIRDLYRSGMDMKRRNTLGLSPLTPLLKKIEKISSVDDLTTVVATLHRLGVGVIWGTGIEQDAKNSSKYAFHLAQDGLGLPDKDYYLKDDAESLRIRNAYEAHVVKLFRLMGRSAGDATSDKEKVMRIETALAKASMAKEEMRDPDKTYHKMTFGKLRAIAPRISWSQYLKVSKCEKAPYVIVMQPNFIASVNSLLSSIPLNEWKTYLSFHLVNDYASALSEPFIKESFSFYGKVLNGTQKMQPLWRRVLGTINGVLGEYLGQTYVKRYFTKAAKDKMNLLVDDLFTIFESRIRGLDWMTPGTKKKALLKLRAFNRKIGYPDKWKSYKGLRIEADDFVGNLFRANEFEHARAVKKLGKPIDRAEWFMYPQTVNAYFAPSLNDIVFPAAILQPPFFDLTADDAVNYGCIGAVIGHEITHGFDDEGSKFDAKGNLKSWWTKEDRTRFDAKAKKVEKQFDAYTVADGLHVNGKLTLGENIADLGGLSIAYDAYQLQLARTGRKDIDGLTPEQRFFIAFAVFERENSRPAQVKKQVLTDPHSPGIFRINGPVSNFDPFYEAYQVSKQDRLYRNPKDREMVW